MKMSFKIPAFVICSVIFFCGFTYGASISVVSDFDNDSAKEIVTRLQSYLSGKNIKTTLTQYLLEKEDRPALTQKINSAKNDIIFVIGRKSLEYAARDFSSNTPVVFTVVADYKVEDSQKVAGITLGVPDEKKISLIKEILPDTSRVGVIYSNSFRVKAEGLQQAVEKHGLKYVENVINSEQDFVSALTNMLPNIDCFIMFPDDKIYFSTTMKLLFFESLKRNVPVIGLNKYYTQMGAVCSVECDTEELGKQAGRMVERILAGESPNAIGIESPKRFSTSINLITAQKCGRKIPQEAVNDAQKVFQ